jgi:hypothetical protein
MNPASKVAQAPTQNVRAAIVDGWSDTQKMSFAKASRKRGR